MTALPEDLSRLLEHERGWPVPMTEAEYLEFERRSRLKHEFVDGLVWLWSGYDYLDTQTGLAGASEAHNLIQGNVYAWARPRAAARGCRVYFGEMRFRDERSGRYYYPDVMAVCAAGPPDTPYVKSRPCLVVEVISAGDDIEEFRQDRVELNEKLAAYQSTPSVQTYLVISQRQRRLLWYRREPDGRWSSDVVTEGAVAVPCLGADLGLEAIYEGVLS